MRPTRIRSFLPVGCGPPLTAGLLLLAVGVPAGTAAKTRLELSSTHKVEAEDNRDLDPSGQARSTLTATQTGSANLLVDGRRLDLTFNYNFDFETEMGERIDDSTRHQALGTGQLELFEDYFFIDARTLWTRVTLNETGAVGSGPGSGRANQTTSRTIDISPYFSHTFGNLVDTELRYRYATNVVGAASIGRTKIDEQRFRAETGEVWTRLKLTSLLEHSRTDSSANNSGDLERYTAELKSQYAITRHFSLLGSTGLERIDRGLLIDQPYEKIWSLGFLTRPGPRTELELTYGRRYGGPNINGSLHYKLSPRMVFTASYNETVETTQQALGLDRLERATGLEAGLGLEPGQLFDPRTGLPADINDTGLGLRPEVLDTRRLSASLIGTFDRLSTTTTLTREQRSSTGGGSSSNLAGVSQTTTWKLTPNADLISTFSVRKISADTAETSYTLLGRTAINQKLSEQTTGTVGITRIQRLSPAASDRYLDNTIYGSLTFKY